MPKNELKDHVIIPRDHLVELETVAYDNSHVPTVGERTGSIIQTILVAGAAAGAFAAGSWGWAKAMDFLDERKFRRQMESKKFDRDNLPQ